MERLIGEQLGNYLILEELGRGGMARVFRARQINLDRECALKLLRPELAEDETFIDRFLREARAVARLDHPNIVPVYDTGRIGPYHYLAMKFLDGLTLARILQGGRLDLRRVAAYVGQAAAALEYAHQQGVVHRDVKPGNIMVDDRGWLTITDFGLARLSQEMRMTITGTLLGTPAYMAPEQVSGDSVTPRTDIYQLGVVTYEMLTGATPFRDRPQHAMLLAHLQEQPAPLYDLNEELTPDIDQIVQRSLAKSPSDRYQSVSEFSQDLIRAIFATLPAEEQGRRVGPYDVSRLPETVSWSEADNTPFRVPTDRLSAGPPEPGASPVSSSQEIAAEPSSEQIRQAGITTKRSVHDGEAMAAAGVAGAPGLDIPAEGPPAGAADTPGATSRRYLVVGGAVLALITAISVASFQFGIVGGAGSNDDPTPTATPTELEAVAPEESPTASPASTATLPGVAPGTDTETPTPINTPAAEPTQGPSPTATPRPAATPQPTRTPIIIFTPTPDPDPPAVTPPPDSIPSEGQILLDVDFNNWFTGPLENGEIFIADGAYHLRESAGGGLWIFAYSASDQPFTDFSVSVDLRGVSGDASAEACVMARVDSLNQQYNYALCINGEGGIKAVYEQFNSDGTGYVAEPLLSPGEHTAAPPDAWTTLKIIIRGEELWFFVNGGLAGSAQHTGPSGGEIGIIVNNFGQSPAEYEFTNLVVRALE